MQKYAKRKKVTVHLRISALIHDDQRMNGKLIIYEWETPLRKTVGRQPVSDASGNRDMYYVHLNANDTGRRNNLGAQPPKSQHMGIVGVLLCGEIWSLRHSKALGTWAGRN